MENSRARVAIIRSDNKEDSVTALTVHLLQDDIDDASSIASNAYYGIVPIFFYPVTILIVALSNLACTEISANN